MPAHRREIRGQLGTIRLENQGQIRAASPVLLHQAREMQGGPVSLRVSLHTHVTTAFTDSSHRHSHAHVHTHMNLQGQHTARAPTQWQEGQATRTSLGHEGGSEPERSVGTAPCWTKRILHRCACKAPGQCVCSGCCARIALAGRPWPGAGPPRPPVPVGTSGQGELCHGSFPPCARSVMNAEQGVLPVATLLTVKTNFSICDGQHVILPTTSQGVK